MGLDVVLGQALDEWQARLVNSMSHSESKAHLDLLGACEFRSEESDADRRRLPRRP